MKFLMNSILFSVLLGQHAWAGVVHGGGGVAVVCRDQQNKIKSAELLDLFEARARGLKLIPDNSLASNYGRFMRRWIEFNGGTPAQESETLIYNRLNDILMKAFITSPGQKLPFTGDFTTGPIPKDCSFEQLAVFRDEVILLFIDREIWNALDQQSRAALLAHEIVYRNDRAVYGYSDSNKARKLVGRFFSTTPLIEERR